MKNLTRLFLVLMFTGIAFSGCKDALDVTFEADYTSNMDIVVSPSTQKATNGTFSSTTTIDPLSNSDVADYANNIQSIEIVEARGTITAVSTTATMQTANLEITSLEMPAASWNYTNEPIAVGSIFTLTNEDGQLDKLSDILSTKNVFTIHFTGQTDQDDITFTMQVYIRAMVTANPL